MEKIVENIISDGLYGLEIERVIETFAVLFAVRDNDAFVKLIQDCWRLL